MEDEDERQARLDKLQKLLSQPTPKNTLDEFLSKLEPKKRKQFLEFLSSSESKKAVYILCEKEYISVWGHFCSPLGVWVKSK